MVGILGLVWAVVAIWLGASGASWWAVPILAVAGLVLYFFLRYPYLIRDFQIRNPIVIVGAYYCTQIITAGALFSIGRGIGSLLG